MKTSFILLWILFGFNSIEASGIDCAEAHSPATYALSHAKKSLKADNFDHQKYYAERALEAFEKTKALIENCGCQEALNAITQGSENLKKAAEPNDWDKGRFYVKKAYADAQNLISSLEMCTSGKKQTTFPDDEYVSDNGSDDVERLNEKKILDQQKRLKEQQQKLLEEQRKLDLELEEQRKLAEQREIARQKELQQQIRLKVKAEQALQNFEKSITELTEILGCEEAYSIIQDSYLRAEKALESESLKGTKRYYTEKAKEIARQALNGLEGCAYQN
ncbi:hypothetical protein GTQ40_16725 [Flavobacteriaceae bacterium R38]|nr:hypothetical protein [Flavobacteriaceae bacterium R38]